MALNTLEFTRMGNLAYQAIRDAIFSGEFESGTRLNQDDLARRLGVSRAPIRDALNRLETEGLVQTLSRAGGVVVAEATEQEMADIYELRAILDTACTRLACERIGEEDLKRLQQIVDETERVTTANDLQGIVQAHAEFHYLIYAASANPELTRVAKNLWDRSYRYRVLALEQRGERPPGPGAAPSHPGSAPGEKRRPGRGTCGGARSVEHPTSPQPN